MLPINEKYFRRNVGKIKKDSKYEISCCCPLCGDQKNRLHLVHVAQGDYDYVKCFNSGCQVEEPTSVLSFLYHLASQDIDGYKREAFKGKVEDIKSNFSLNELVKKVQKEVPEVPEVQVPKAPRTNEPTVPQILLDKFHLAKDNQECMEYLTKRKITPKDDWLYSTDKFFNFNGKSLFVENFLIIPIYNKQSVFKGWYSRSIKDKQFSTFLLPDTLKFWALDPTSNPEIICEGILDALSTGFDEPGAAISADIPNEILVYLPKGTIIAFDNDETGIRKSIDYKDFQVFVWPDYLDDFKDFNDLLVAGKPIEEIKQIILENLYTGILAETRLRMKSH